MDPKHMQIARAYLGLREVVGDQANPKIVEWLLDTTIPDKIARSDETAWCAAFAGGVLKESGYRLSRFGGGGTGLANARSYEAYGEPIMPEDVRRGDIVVFWRGSRDSASGHVAFVEAIDHARRVVKALGGNQGNAVSYQEFPFDRVVCYRRVTLEDQTYG